MRKADQRIQKLKKVAQAKSDTSQMIKKFERSIGLKVGTKKYMRGIKKR